jgi:small GTP-binding protein
MKKFVNFANAHCADTHKHRDMKIITVGDSGVGKTSLLLALLRHIAPEHPALRAHSISAQEPEYETVPTIGVDQFDILLGNSVPVELWDTAGQERFMSLTANYFRDADIVIVVCAATDKESVASLRGKWIKLMMENTSFGSRPSLIVVCNKTDHAQSDKAVLDDAEALALQHGAPFLATSAATGAVGELALQLAKLVMDKHTATDVASLSSLSSVSHVSSSMRSRQQPHRTSNASSHRRRQEQETVGCCGV